MDDQTRNPDLTDEQRLDWLRLIRSDNVGPRTFRMLIDRFGNAGDALEALPSLARRGGASGPSSIPTREDAERELAAASRLGVSLVATGEAGYPPRLAMIDDAPPLLGIRGSVDAMTPMIAIVGSATPPAPDKNSRKRSRTISATPASSSSPALRAGSISPRIAAAWAQGPVAVLAGGHDHVYPSEHIPVLEQIIDAGGGALSELPMGHQPRARDFPRRNRLISGAALGVVLVEAAHRSGSLITARFANEQGREVFAVPGSPLDPRAAGTNDLIKQGATLVTSATDVIEVLEPIMERPLSANEPGDDYSSIGEPADHERTQIVNLLGPSPIGLDDLIRLSGLSPAIVRTVLLELDLAGRLERHGGGSISLV